MADVITALMAIEWKQPLWFLLSLQPLLLGLVLRWLQTNKLRLFADDSLLAWIQVKPTHTLTQKVFSRNVAYALAWLLFSLALAGPRIADDQSINDDESNVDIIMVIDVSPSMHATDIAPSRLRRAVLETYELLAMTKNSRIGVVVYAARPHLFVPLTSDYNALKFYLQDLDSLQLPTNGSDARKALRFAQKEFTHALNQKPSNRHVMLWLTDGDIQVNQIDELESVLKQANHNQISTHIMGLGTIEGSGVPLADGSWVADQGQGVISKMRIDLLQRLAQLGNGRFAVVSDDESDWNMLYQEGIRDNIRAKKVSNKAQWKPLYRWVLFPAILLLLIALFPLPISWKVYRES